MPIIQVDHVTQEYKPGQLTSLKHTSLNDTPTREVSVLNAFVGAASAAKTENRYLTLLAF